MQNEIKSFQKIFERDLRTLEKEIAAYPSDEGLWKLAPGIANSAGNLCLHLCGNLQHFVGTLLGHTGYQRKRDEEFSRKGLSKRDLLDEIAATHQAVQETLVALPDEILQKVYPSDVLKEEVNTHFFLLHLVSHFNYHLGQINYHRRMLNNI